MDGATLVRRLTEIDRANPPVDPVAAEAGMTIAMRRSDTLRPWTRSPVMWLDSPGAVAAAIQSAGPRADIEIHRLLEPALEFERPSEPFTGLFRQEDVAWANARSLRLGGEVPNPLAGWRGHRLPIYEENELDAVRDAYAAGAWALILLGGAGWGRRRAWVLRRPGYSLDEGNRFHSATGPALSWPWGPYLWSIHGTNVGEDLILHPERITTDQIRRQRNVEVRRVMTELYGFGRYMTDSGGRLLHEDTDRLGHERKLWDLPQDGDESLRLVQVMNSSLEPDGTRRSYFLRVPPNVATCAQAVAWTVGKTELEYSPAAET